MTGKASVVLRAYYPQTENWQKTIGGYQVWSHSKIHVDGDTVTMQITVQGEDRYNFNRGQHDVATGASDNENGRFTEIGGPNRSTPMVRSPGPSPGSLATFRTCRRAQKVAQMMSHVAASEIAGQASFAPTRNH